MGDHNAYMGGIPGSRDPTPMEQDTLSSIFAALVMQMGVPHAIRFLGAMMTLIDAIGQQEDSEIHFDCFDRVDADGKVYGFVYVGSEHLDTMGVREDLKEHFAKLHARHVEAVRAMEAKRPKEN